MEIQNPILCLRKKYPTKFWAQNKIFLLTAYRSKVIFCISKTNLDSSLDDETIESQLITYSELTNSIIRKEEEYVYTSKNYTFYKLKLLIEYPLPYERQIWNYQHTDANPIKKSLNQDNCNELFRNKNVNKQVALLTGIILNVFITSC